MSEKDYEAGEKQAILGVLQHCCNALGYKEPEIQKVSWIQEREAVISTLRNICRDYGDNNWQSNLHLSDIIDKHLHRNLGYK